MYFCKTLGYLGRFFDNYWSKIGRTRQGCLSCGKEWRWRDAFSLSSLLISDESGQSIMLIVVFIGMFLLGFMALGLDVGLLFHEKRMAQTAADAAAVAAAEEASSGNPSNEQTVANAMAKMNGFDPNASLNPATVTL